MASYRSVTLLLLLVCLLLGFGSGALGAKPIPVCGDGKCQKGEDLTCPLDCGIVAICGDSVCEGDESYESCPEDCEPPPPQFCNNDGICNLGEDCMSCPGDCAGITTGKPSNRYCCGLDTCEETLCGLDCGIPGTADPYCGDGIIDASLGEECDDAGESSFCDDDCTLRFCGDFTLNLSAGEECDEGGETAGCDADCTFAECGDGTINTAAGEECDDGNTIPGDLCDASCLIETPAGFCGDGELDAAAGEECDDGNTIPDDGCDADCQIEPQMGLVPSNQFNIGDSIGEAEAADGSIGSANHETVWSTGFDGGDSVASLNERFEVEDAAGYYENDLARDGLFNQAISGETMAGFAAQADSVAAIAGSVTIPGQTAGMVTILLGNNDVCAVSLEAMTVTGIFEAQYRAGLDALAQDPATATANIHVSGIPAIYWLWNAKRGDFWCRVFAWPFVPCENLLDDPADDCANDASRMDPDTIHPTGPDDPLADGPNCTRRKLFHARIRDEYNPILENVLQEYIDNGLLPNASYVDIFDVQFGGAHVNGGDCFHPSEAGHSLLADEQWCRSIWSVPDDPVCSP